ncbi:MAG: SDR family oxidoreductase [Clostridia bacterium]|nr:SDR family oxidoreductase [Clostridia bacterium]
MNVLITGASSGIGRDMARTLHQMGHDLILVARRRDMLLELKDELGGKPRIISLDLSDEKNCFELCEELKDQNIDILINNAGFGVFGEFSQTPLRRELEMIDLNIRALHILTKKFLADFEQKNSGYILNVASSAAFLPGPLLSGYYATKAYVQRLTLAISEELRRKKSNVYIGALCPGPVDTEFNKTAGVSFNLKSLPSKKVAEYGIRKMFRRKLIIIPGLTIRLGVFFQRFIPTKLLLKISYNIQKSKG